MPDNASSNVQILIDSVKYVFGLLIVMYAWLGKRLFHKYDLLERNKVSNDRFEREIKMFREDLITVSDDIKSVIKDYHKENREDHKELHKRIDGLK